ncbi:MAG: metal-dependent hydrolase [Oscillospiraceae bacterium]|nr:metal-dependent hydrolase [Oscillospiraceae bacterium]
MLGKTHVAMGIASSLAILRPTTVPGILCTIAGGTIGGWICDLDCRDSEVVEGAVTGLIFSAVIAGISLFLNYHLDRGMITYLFHQVEQESLMGLTVFLGCCLYGVFTSHRTFMHSFLALGVLCGGIYLVYPPLTYPFLVGFVSHLLLDITNKRGLQLFFPIPARICFGICASNKKANDIILNLAVIASVVLATILTIFALFFHQSPMNPTIPMLQGKMDAKDGFFLYLLAVNILTFLLFCIHDLICRFTKLDNRWGMRVVRSVLSFLGIAGGSFGMLLYFVIFRQKIRKKDIHGYAIASSLTIVWAVMCEIVFDPFGWGYGRLHPDVQFHWLLIVYLLLVNLVNLCLFLTGKQNARTGKKLWEGLLFGLGVMGGSLGGLVALGMLGKKRTSALFPVGFPVLLAVHTCLVVGLLFAGVV